MDRPVEDTDDDTKARRETGIDDSFDRLGRGKSLRTTDTGDDPFCLSRRTMLRATALTAGAGLLGTGTTGTVVATSGDGEFTTTDVDIDSFDGTTLAATLYEPRGNDRTPAMLLTHGYGGDRSDVDPWASMYAQNGYTTLTYDSRGFGNSGGEVNVDGPKEVKDAQTLITWLADDGNAKVKKDGPDDPRIGMDGLSYAGGIQLNTAAAEGRGDGVSESNDRLDAIVPRWAWHDLAYSLAPNGVVKDGWETLLLGTGAEGSRDEGDAMDRLQGQTPRLYEYYTQALAANEYPDVAKEFFENRSPVQDIDDITAPALFVHGWPDTLFVPTETVRNLTGIDTEHRTIFFNGGHSFRLLESEPYFGDPSQKDFIDRKALDWIDTHVGGGGSTDLPAVTYYEVQTGEWSTADAIPPADAEPQTVNLADASTGESTLVFNTVIPTSTSQLVPVNADTSVTAIDFDFPVGAETEILGVPHLSLGVEPLGPEARLFTKFSHVHDGDATLINNQVTPLKTEGEPGTVETVDIEMVPFQRRLAPGDTLRFTVATTDAGFLSSRTSAGASIRHSEQHPSTVDVPVISGGFTSPIE